MWLASGNALLLVALFGTASSTVFETVTYEASTQCQTKELTTTYFGVPDDDGLAPFNVCHSAAGNSTGSYLKYKCSSGTGVAEVYPTDNCTSSGAADEVASITSDTCANEQTSSCSNTDPDFNGAMDDFIVTMTQYVGESCSAEPVDTYTRTMQEYTDPTTGGTGICSDSTLMGFKSKLACVDEKILTFYYDSSDADCSGDPSAVVDVDKVCLAGTDNDGETFHYEASCAATPAISVPSLSGDEVTYYTRVQMFEDSGNASMPSNCSVPILDVYYAGVPIEDDVVIPFDTCAEGEDGTFAMAVCDVDSSSINMTQYADSNCSSDNATTSIVTYGETCAFGMMQSCSMQAPVITATVVNWDVHVEYHEDETCSNGTGVEATMTWAEALATDMLFLDISSSSMDDEDSMGDDDMGVEFDSEHCGGDGYAGVESPTMYAIFNGTEGFIYNMTTDSFDYGAFNETEGYVYNATGGYWMYNNTASTGAFYNETAEHWCFPYDSDMHGSEGDFDIMDAFSEAGCRMLGNMSYSALRCVNGELKAVVYDSSDSTCSGSMVKTYVPSMCVNWAASGEVDMFGLMTCVEASAADDGDGAPDDNNGDGDDGDDDSGPVSGAAALVERQHHLCWAVFTAFAGGCLTSFVSSLGHL